MISLRLAFLCVQVAKKLRELSQEDSAEQSANFQEFCFRAVDVSNVLLLRFYNQVTSQSDEKLLSAEKEHTNEHAGASKSACEVHSNSSAHILGQTQIDTESLHDSSHFQNLRRSEVSDKDRGYLLPKKISDRLQKRRNALAHGGDATILDVLKCFQEVKHYLCSSSKKLQNHHRKYLQGVEISIDILKNVPTLLNTMRLMLEPQTAARSSRLLLSVPRELIGREDILKQLIRLMTPPKSVESTGPHSTTRWPRVLLHGPPGIGKTAVVRELSRRLEKSHPHQHSFQATTEMTLLVDINLFLTLEMGDKIEVSPTSVQPRFKDYLFQTKKTFFLVFEDVGDPQLIMSLLPMNSHCVVFTSSSDLSWEKQGFIPEQVDSLSLEGLSEEDSFRLVAHILTSNGHKELFINICRRAAEKECLRSFVFKNMLGLPLAVRLVGFQLCYNKGCSLDIADVSKLGSSRERSSVDEKAAGRVHVRGFHYVVRHALEGISNGMKSLMVCFLLSILKWGETPTYFLEELLKRLNLTSDQICVSMESLMKTGLVTRLGEDYSMHQVVQSHVRTIVSSSFPQLKESIVASFLQTLKSETILSTRMTLSERAATLGSSSVTKTNGVFGGEKLEVDQQNKNFEIERLITAFLSVAEDLQLSWKQRDLCLRCLLLCFQRRRADEDDVLDMMRDTFFESFPCDFALLNLVQDDEETVCSMLLARWSFLFEKSPKPLENISSEISQLLSAGSTIEPIRLLHCGANALLNIPVYKHVPALFLNFGLSVDSLVRLFQERKDEIFCSCSLICSKALSKRTEFGRARRLFLNVVHVWLPNSERFTVNCHEEIMQTAFRLCAHFSSDDMYVDALHICDVAYTISNIDSYSQHRPALSLLACYRASHILAKLSFSPEHHGSVPNQGRIWLHRALYFTRNVNVGSLSPNALEELVHIFFFLFRAGAACAFYTGMPSPLASAAGEKAVELFNYMRIERKLSCGGFDFVSSLRPLLLAASGVRNLSELDERAATQVCQKLAEAIKQSEVVADDIHTDLQRLHQLLFSLSSSGKCALINFNYAFLQKLLLVVPRSESILQNPLCASNAGREESSGKSDADPAVIRKVIDFLTKELMFCGKVKLAKVLQEAFQLWPPNVFREDQLSST